MQILFTSVGNHDHVDDDDEMKMLFTKVGVTFNGKPMSVADQGATLGKEGKTKLFTLVGFLIKDCWPKHW